MGFTKGDLILEIGYAADCDDSLRAKIKGFTDTEFIQVDPTEVIDGVLLWWRDGDGDLIDELMDALTFLSETGPIWVMTPKMSCDGLPRAIEETSEVSVSVEVAAAKSE